MSSVFDSPNPMLFGGGMSKLTGEKLKEFGCTKVLVVSDQGVKAAGIVDKILDSIKASGIDTVLFDKVEANPPDYVVNEAGALGVAEKVDGIVAVGGGSSLDAGKGARILLTYPGPINQYFAKVDGRPLDERSMKPIIVIPTTAGTGSEATPGGIVVDTSVNMKRPFICSATLAIIDPELTIGLPPGVTAATGIDALCHAVEAMTSRAHNRISETLGKEAVTLISKYLPIACKDGTNMEARENMALAATLAGMCLRGPFGGIPHDIGSCVGVKYSIPHGTAVGLFLPEGLKFIAPVIPEKVKLVAECLGAVIPANASPEEIGSIASDSVRQIFRQLGLPELKNLVASKQDMIENVDKLYKNTSFTPRPLTRDDVIEILIKSYDT